MQQNYQQTQLPTSASQSPSEGGASWSNPSRITADDSSSAALAYFAGGDGGATISGGDFPFNLPPGAAIDGIEVLIDGSNTGCYGGIVLNLPDTVAKEFGAVTSPFGSATDLWGAGEILAADIANLSVDVYTGDISGGDGIMSIDCIKVTIYYHIDMAVAPADVPTRLAYKVYSREGNYLGELPNVTSRFGFPQDINAAGAAITIECGGSINDGIALEPLLEEDDDQLLTEDDIGLLAARTSTLIERGDSPDEALYKNSNRIKVILYNYWYPNGKVMFSGQVNRVGFRYGAGNGVVKLKVLSDGLDMAHYIARGYPFNYSTDDTQTAQNGFLTVTAAGIGAAFYKVGQTITTGGAVTNIGAIQLLLQGSANVTVSFYDAPNGNLIGSVSKNVSYGSPTVDQFEFPSLLSVPSATSRFFAISVDPGQSINVYRNSTSVYADGTAYEADFGGGSGGGSFGAIAGDLYFVTKYGTPTTTATYTDDDPITDMMAGVLLDYNGRGGRIHRRHFEATGLSLTYTFNMATIADVQKKTLEMAPAGYFSFVDLGTAEMDMLPTSPTADFTVVRGKNITELDMDLTIEQVKNYLLFTGGEDPDSPGNNLFREYPDTESAAFYGQRYLPKTDNRVVLDETADAIGEAFIAENAGEVQETTLTVPGTEMDITLLTPGKTIGFRNFGTFIDEMVLQIVRREYSVGQVTLTLGRLPIRTSDLIEKLNRELINEQTVNNPTAPS